jgi:hypothetical protein
MRSRARVGFSLESEFAGGSTPLGLDSSVLEVTGALRSGRASSTPGFRISLSPRSNVSRGVCAGRVTAPVRVVSV